MRKYLDANIIYDTNKLSKAQWLKHRQEGIGGSDASSVLGLNPYKSKVKIYIDKLSEVVDEDNSNYKMELGKKLEDFVAKEFSLKTGKKVRNINGILRNEKYPFAIANIDKAVVSEKAFLECRVTNSFCKKEWENEVPLHYQIQCHHYMGVTGASHCYVCVLIGNEELVIHKLDRDEKMIEEIMKTEEAFWKEYILGDSVPLADGSSDYSEYLGKRFKNVNAESMILFMQEKNLKKLQELNTNIKQLENKKKSIEQAIQSEMGNYQVAYIGDKKITWKEQTRNSFDTKTFKIDHPQLYNKYLKAKNSRVFKINN